MLPASQLHVHRRLEALGRSAESRIDAEDILFGAPNPLARGKFDPEYHPDAMLAYFRAAAQEMESEGGTIERVRTKQGDVRYVRRPVSPPTLSGFAAQVGVSSQTLQKWADEFPEFREAWDICRDIQMQVFTEMGAHSAYNASITALMFKNLLGWHEKAETTHKGGVVIHIDADDANA
jgi:hypothetical protein